MADGTWEGSGSLQRVLREGRAAAASLLTEEEPMDYSPDRRPAVSPLEGQPN